MSVAVPPKSAPVLEGVRPSYEVGEILQAECTSGLSYPPAILTFFLNDKEVSRCSWTTARITSFKFSRGRTSSERRSDKPSRFRVSCTTLNNFSQFISLRIIGQKTTYLSQI